MDDAAGLTSVASDPEGFRTARDVSTQAEAEVRRRHLAWLNASEQLRKDPTLALYYAFHTSEPYSGVLLDQVAGLRPPHDGMIVGAAWSTGRWPGTQALQFSRVSDRVRLHVPGEFSSLTLATWVWVDDLPNKNNALLMSDGWESGELHWQIGSDGTLILGVQQLPKGKGAHYYAVQAFTPDLFGQWVHLAVVYDQENGVVTHYINGRPAMPEPVLFEIPLVIGDADVGNWSLASHKNSTPIRFLNGRMEELMLFTRPLASAELEQLHAQGQPPQ